MLYATDHFNTSPVCENLAQCGALFAWEDNCHFLLMLPNIFSQFVTINTAQCEDVKINCRNRHSWTKKSFLFSFFIQYWMTFLNVGLEPASARKTSEPAVKTTPPNIAPTLLTRTLWEGFRYQIRWIFGKIPNGLWPLLIFRKKFYNGNGCIYARRHRPYSIR